MPWSTFILKVVLPGFALRVVIRITLIGSSRSIDGGGVSIAQYMRCFHIGRVHTEERALSFCGRSASLYSTAGNVQSITLLDPFTSSTVCGTPSITINGSESALGLTLFLPLISTFIIPLAEAPSGVMVSPGTLPCKATNGFITGIFSISSPFTFTIVALLPFSWW